MMRAIRLTSVFGLMLALNGTLRAEETKGTIKSVDTARNEVVLKGVVKDSIYELNKNATVWLDGVRSKIGDLAGDDRAVIYYEKSGEHMIANQVRALRTAKETTGNVQDVFAAKNQITLKGVVSNSTYELNKDATVFIDGKAATLTDIRVDDQVLVTYVQRGDRYMANDVTVLKRK